MADQPTPRQPKGIDELTGQQPGPDAKSGPADGSGTGQSSGSQPSTLTPQRGVDMAGVPSQKPTSGPEPHKPAPAGQQNGNRKDGRLARAPESSVPRGGGSYPANGAAPPAPTRPDDAPPVDVDAVGEPLADSPGDEDDNRNNLPDPRDFMEDESQAKPSEPEWQPNSSPEQGQPSAKTGKGELAGGKPGGVPGSSPGTSGIGGGAAAGQGSGAEAGQAGATAARTAAMAGARAAAAGAGAAAASPAGWVAIAVALALVILAMVFFLVIPGMAGTGEANTPSNNQTQGGDMTVSGNVQQLARQILDSDRITIQPNPTGSLQAAAQGKCSPVPSAGACVKLDPKLLSAILTVSQKYPLVITSLTTGVHAGCSNHYQGRAVDLGSTDRSILEEFRKLGATELLGPGDPDHDTHLHAAWDGPNKICA